MTKFLSDVQLGTQLQYIVVRFLEPPQGLWRVSPCLSTCVHNKPLELHSIWETRLVAEAVARFLNGPGDPRGILPEHLYLAPPLVSPVPTCPARPASQGPPGRNGRAT